MEPQDLLELVYGAGKKPGIFFHDAWNEYALVLPEKTKIQFDYGWRIALLHGIYQEPQWPQH
jgi:hypothetical protein